MGRKGYWVRRATSVLLALTVAIATSPAWGLEFYSDNFDSYSDDAGVTGAGWVISDTATVTETGTHWTVMNPGGRANPPSIDGTPTTGGFIISDSDYGGDASNPTNSGASHDLITPSFSTIGGGDVWLNADLSVQLKNNGAAVFDIDPAVLPSWATSMASGPGG